VNTAESLKAAKRACRIAAIGRRRAAKAAAGVDASNQALDHLLAAVTIPRAAVVSGYWPIDDEFDDRPLLDHFAKAGHVCALPVVTMKHAPLEFRAWRPGDAMIVGRLDIPEPLPDAQTVEPSMLLVPLLAFDRAGFRLGYGGGFYDRTLARLRATSPIVAIGVAFAAQEVDEVPRGHSDQPLDWVVTERRAVVFGARGRQERMS
jgi:5-formyltetrahydrofolate cyclo-ligase